MTYKDPDIIVTVDIVLFTLKDGRLHVVLTERDQEPFKNCIALPGGFVRKEEDHNSVDAARRVLKTKTGIDAPYLEQLYTFADDARDPRGWTVSIAYYALVNETTLTQNGTEAFQLVNVERIPRLAFDHNRIIEAALRRVQDKSTYSSLPCYLLSESFTLSDLQRTYEQVLGTKLDKSSFRRKLDAMGFLETAKGTQGGQHRPAQLYRLKKPTVLTFFENPFKNP